MQDLFLHTWMADGWCDKIKKNNKKLKSVIYTKNVNNCGSE